MGDVLNPSVDTSDLYTLAFAEEKAEVQREWGKPTESQSTEMAGFHANCGQGDGAQVS